MAQRTECFNSLVASTNLEDKDTRNPDSWASDIWGTNAPFELAFHQDKLKTEA